MYSFNGLINWCYLLSLPHLLFTHFPSFSLWFISLSQLCSCIHGLMCFHVCGTAHGTSQCKPKSAMDSAPLTCVLGAGHWSYQGQDGEKSKVWLRSTYIFQISVLAGWLTQFPSIYIFHICFGLFLLWQKEVERKSAQENKYGEVTLK